MKIITWIATTGLALGMASSAFAGLIHDYQNVGTFLSEGHSKTIVHDLTDDGVPEDFSVTSAWLRLAFADDPGLSRSEDLALDIADISADGVSGTYEVDGSHKYGYDIQWLGVGSDGVDTLNSSGLLSVTVTAVETHWFKGHNDFWWKTSLLKANVEERAVTEPGTLALLGLGLAGLGAARRRQKA